MENYQNPFSVLLNYNGVTCWATWSSGNSAVRMDAASEDTEQHLCAQKHRAEIEIPQIAKSLRHFDFSYMLQSGDGDSSGIFMVISRLIIFRSVVRKLSKL